ncbi:MAG TPA: tRNA (adenosine(37)-N6)-threonylcarbamoyltransferase complex dimerization subunit type 1 TsaB [Vicinamibacterales bacterium]|nr:tRNA (adenosine(37)-N6)-threonylcarbamoyltransferase complex dimerization subunit type 1 TsaB [Vicinamibacterales bacterium]
MFVLALDTATRAGSVALVRDGAAQAMAGDGTRTHGERLPAELLDFLARHGATLADVTHFAIVVGPGSFTGLRVGMATVQGLAFAASRPVISVPTLDAYASGWLDGGRRADVFAACMDGHRGEVFLAAFDLGDATSFDSARVLLEPLAAPAHAAAAALMRAADGRTVTLVGEGLDPHLDAFRAARPDIVIAAPAMTLAEAAARLAARHPERGTAPHAIKPVYVRRTDAEIAREKSRATAVDVAAFTIERAEPTTNLEAVAALQRLTFTNPWGADAMRWELEHTDVARLYLLRAPDGVLVGYCACWLVFDELHINSLAVDPAWRRRGLARHLLAAVFGDAAALGARAATLEVRRSNDAARGLYEGLGFRVEGTRRDYYQNPREDGLILWRRGL